MMRFNHAEITVPAGFVSQNGEDLQAFLVGELGFQRSVFPGLEIPHMIFITDPSASQFLFIAESETPVVVGGDDHHGLHVDDADQVEEYLARCENWRRRDARLEIRDLGVLDLEATTTRGFYLRYLLPVWFDVQHIRHKPGFEPTHEWRFVPRQSQSGGR